MESKNCNKCCKKLRVVNFKCKCGFLFCINCRLPEIHLCSFDHSDKTNLEKKLVKLIAKKLDKI